MSFPARLRNISGLNNGYFYWKPLCMKCLCNEHLPTGVKNICVVANGSKKHVFQTARCFFFKVIGTYMNLLEQSLVYGLGRVRPYYMVTKRKDELISPQIFMRSFRDLMVKGRE